VMRTIPLALLGVCLLAALVACGKQGDLDRPGPMWGAKAKAEYMAQKRAQADAAGTAATSNSVAQPKDPWVTPYTTAAPAREAPIPGKRGYPSGSPQPGAMQDPLGPQ
jgi:hypothetical protein